MKKIHGGRSGLEWIFENTASLLNKLPACVFPIPIRRTYFVTALRRPARSLAQQMAGALPGGLEGPFGAYFFTLDSHIISEIDFHFLLYMRSNVTFSNFFFLELGLEEGSEALLTLI